MKYAQFGQTLDIENKKYKIWSKMHGMLAVWTQWSENGKIYHNYVMIFAYFDLSQ